MGSAVPAPKGSARRLSQQGGARHFACAATAPRGTRSLRVATAAAAPSFPLSHRTRWCDFYKQWVRSIASHGAVLATSHPHPHRASHFASARTDQPLHNHGAVPATSHSWGSASHFTLTGASHFTLMGHTHGCQPLHTHGTQCQPLRASGAQRRKRFGQTLLEVTRRSWARMKVSGPRRTARPLGWEHR